MSPRRWLVLLLFTLLVVPLPALADRAGVYYSIRPTRASRQLIFVQTSFTSPPDSYRMGWDGSAIARLTWANEEL